MSRKKVILMSLISIILVSGCATIEKAKKLDNKSELEVKKIEYEKQTAARFTVDTLEYSIQNTIDIYKGTKAYIKYDVFFRPAWTGKQMQQVLHDSVFYSLKIQLLQGMYLFKNRILDNEPFVLTTQKISGSEPQCVAFEKNFKKLQKAYLKKRLTLSGNALKDLQGNLITKAAEDIVKSFEIKPKNLFADEFTK